MSRDQLSLLHDKMSRMERTIADQGERINVLEKELFFSKGGTLFVKKSQEFIHSAQHQSSMHRSTLPDGRFLPCVAGNESYPTSIC